MTDEFRHLILITNDDGIASPGLRAAAEAVLDLGEIWVVAPRRQQSGLGRSFPGGDNAVQEHALEMAGRGFPCFALDGSPAQAVRHGILRFLPRRPDLAISGINYGENVGGSATISGTIGAAIEAASFNVPTLAVSLETDRKYHFNLSEEVDFRTAAVFTRRFALWLLRRGMPKSVDILKVEVPCDATSATPWRMTRVSRQQYWVSRVIVDDDGQKRLASYERRIDLNALEPDSDVYALAVDRVIAVSPITIDLTARVDLQQLEDALDLDDSP